MIIHSARIERFFIPGPAGRLEALLEFRPDVPARRTAIVCHPHPLHGGTMHTKIVFRAAKAALKAGLPCLRFNFRGVGKSDGTFDSRVGERDDARAALDAIAARYPGRPVVMMGFSFGSEVALAVGSVDERVAALVGLGVPAATYDFGFLAGVTKPKLIVQGAQDRFGPRPVLEKLYATLAEPKQIHWVEGADHFCTGRLDEVEHAVRIFLESLPFPADLPESTTPEALESIHPRDPSRKFAG